MLVAEKLVSKIHNAFVTGCYILDSVVLLHETLHSLNKSKQAGVFLEVGFERAYDKINFEFMFSVLEMKGFPRKFVQRIKAVVCNGKVANTLNDMIGS